MNTLDKILIFRPVIASREEARELYKSRFWEHLNSSQLAQYLHEPKLVMPFGIFHDAVEKTFGRPVANAEFANGDLLRWELEHG